MIESAALSHRNFGAALVSALVLTVCAYAAGLNGPLLFDDLPNLTPILDWYNGAIGTSSALFGNQSSGLGRPVAMATFMANIAWFGDSVYALKAVNLGLHLGCALLVSLLIYHILRLHCAAERRAAALAFFVAAIWVSHPIHVSTTLYVVQRMAQLAALFTLAAVLVYVLACRFHGLQAHRWWPDLALFVGFPLLALLAVLSKENGVLAPLLCAAVEFTRPRTGPRPRAIYVFHLLFLAVPMAFAIGLMANGQLQSLFAAYELRDFDLLERLLSQSRALCSYLASIWMPSLVTGSVLVDDFAASKSLFDPVATAWSIGVLSGLVIAAFQFRNRAPLLATGVCLFLFGHAVESTVLPLELYFEHRNYLPSVGALLALIGLAQLLEPSLAKVFAARERLKVRAMLVAGIAMLMLCLLNTLNLSYQWRSEQTLAAHMLAVQPASARARIYAATLASERGDWDQASKALGPLAESEDAEQRRLGEIYTLALRCDFGRSGAAEPALNRLQQLRPSFISLALVGAFEALTARVIGGVCADIDAFGIAELARQYALGAEQSASLHPIWRMRLVSGKLYVHSGRPKEGIAELQAAWDSGGTTAAVGIPLLGALIDAGQVARARQALLLMRARTRQWDETTHTVLDNIQAGLEAMNHAQPAVSD